MEVEKKNMLTLLMSNSYNRHLQVHRRWNAGRGRVKECAEGILPHPNVRPLPLPLSFSALSRSLSFGSSPPESPGSRCAGVQAQTESRPHAWEDRNTFEPTPLSAPPQGYDYCFIVIYRGYIFSVGLRVLWSSYKKMSLLHFGPSLRLNGTAFKYFCLTFNPV